MPRTAQNVPKPPVLTKDDLRYFRNVQGGHGQKVLNAWKKGEVAALGHLKGMISWLETLLQWKKEDAARYTPSTDPEDAEYEAEIEREEQQSLATLNKLIPELKAYSEAAYPGGKKPRKKPLKSQRQELFLKGVISKAEAQKRLQSLLLEGSIESVFNNQVGPASGRWNLAEWGVDWTRIRKSVEDDPRLEIRYGELARQLEGQYGCPPASRIPG